MSTTVNRILSRTMQARRECTAIRVRTVLLSAALILTVSAPSAAAQSEETRPSPDLTENPVSERSLSVTFDGLSSDEVSDRLKDWVTLTDASPQQRQQALTIWNEGAADSSDRTELLMQSLASVDDFAASQLKAAAAGKVPDAGVFDGIREDPLFADACRLFRARWLTQHRFYDEALELLNDADPDQSVDPATLFFCRAVCRSRLMQNEAALEDLRLLLGSTSNVPAHYRTVGEIMRKELEERKQDELNRIARLMSDVSRRLDLGQPGARTQEQEDEIIRLFDELLNQDENEDDQQNQDRNQQGGQGQGGMHQPQPGGSGAQQSTIRNGGAEGESDPRELTEEGTWGLLNEEQQARARELIRSQFPSNYLDAISGYTRKLAERKR